MSVGFAPPANAEHHRGPREITVALRPLLTRAVPLSIAATTALGLMLRLYLLSRPNYLLGVTGYDDGVDFGSALRLVNGALPYRDYAFVQPPGITLLLAPVALVANAAGSDVALAIARVLTALVGAAGIALVGLLVRHRGVAATTVACGLFAVNPDAIVASHTVLLEPWLVLFCLIGVLLVFERDRLTESTSRAVLGGAALGLACLIKAWAILPAIVLVVCFLTMAGPRRRKSLAYVAGLIAAPAIVLAPFAVAAPGGLMRGVILSQLARGDVARTPLMWRLLSFIGIRDLNPGPALTLAVAVALVALITVCVVGATLLSLRSAPPLERFAVATTALVVAAFMWPADYYPHYDAFLEPFLVCAIALPAARLGSALRVRAASGGLTSALEQVRHAAARLRVPRARAVAVIATLRWPVGVFLSSRLLLVVMAVVEHHVRHRPFIAQFATWDGKWYSALALHGYPAHAAHVQTTLGFFPLYPLVIRRVAGLLAHVDLSRPFLEQIQIAGVIVSGVGGAVATVLVQRLATGWWGARSGRRAAVVFCLFPGSVVFSMLYAEGLLIPLVAGCILALQRRRWVLAGTLAGLATATAPQGLVLILVCTVAAARDFHRRRDQSSLWAPALSVAGVTAFASYLWLHVGTPFATFNAQHELWRERTNPFALVDLVHVAVRQVTNPLPGKSTFKPVVAVIGAILLAVLLVIVYRKRRSMSVEALIWTAGVSFLAITSENLAPNPRMLITAFPAVLVLAVCFKGRRFAGLASLSLVLLLGASWLTFTVGHRMLPP